MKNISLEKDKWRQHFRDIQAQILLKETTDSIDSEEIILKRICTLEFVEACEEQIKEETKATVRCIPMEQSGDQGSCIRCGQPANERAIFGKAY